MKIDVIGRGNVGTHLCKALQGNADVNPVAPRTLDGIRGDADIYLISVSDDAISDVAENLKHRVNESSIVAHTSGTTPLSAISPLFANSGVFYPLQTFSKDVELDYIEIPFFIEGSSAEVSNILKEAAKAVSKHVYEADSENRKSLHIASVFACNFVNHLWTLSDKYLTDRGLSFDMLRPLITETCRKACRMRPYEAQTGPAVRRDTVTITSHEKSLAENPGYLKIYEMLTHSIMNNSFSHE